MTSPASWSTRMHPSTRRARAPRPRPREVFDVHVFFRDLEAAPGQVEPAEDTRKQRRSKSFHDWVDELFLLIPERPAVLDSVLAAAMWSTFVCCIAGTTFAHLGLLFVRGAHPVIAFVATFGQTAPVLGSVPVGTLIGIYWHDKYQKAMRSRYTSGGGEGRSMVAWMTVGSAYAGLVALVLGAAILRVTGARVPEGVRTVDVVMLAVSGMGPVIYGLACCSGLLVWYEVMFG